ncbi:hypothetical protein CORC01_10417 [Colletotrichum orchidophilum]|uniref:Uncharacterized protein n=1 Tax=Colletotrichum orchidophilum TaxID=1209926 RepID=A0A1G4AYN7_9PEZI|nr:uncharacterized protein CORC01_10417 [Colletotrichum orchidophilum]OHE94257.1 hypothetical protein CORC01_10417 [Colletotrichum orchidophilum]
MSKFTISTSQLLSADKLKLKELRYEAKTQFYQSHVLDFVSCDVALEDFIDDYIQGYCKLQNCVTPSSSVSFASDDASTRPRSRLRRLLQCITRKKL